VEVRRAWIAGAGEGDPVTIDRRIVKTGQTSGPISCARGKGSARQAPLEGHPPERRAARPFRRRRRAGRLDEQLADDDARPRSAPAPWLLRRRSRARGVRDVGACNEQDEPRPEEARESGLTPDSRSKERRVTPAGGLPRARR
jgi:hypothetical protein